MGRKIAAAIRTELIGTTHVVLIVSGDITFGANSAEYRYASDWLSELYTLIADGCDATCWIICAPGNHDVDHNVSRTVRSTLIQEVTKDPSLSCDQGVIEQCVKEQRGFFDFRADIEGDEILVYDDPLLRIHRIRDDQSTVQINVLNSAWMSSLKEQQGALVFPVVRYREQLQKPDGFSISVVHHPLNWFVPANSRELRDELSRCSSVVLFGHEHMPDSIGVLTTVGDHVRFIDGGVLRDRDTKNESFNVILLDTVAAKFKAHTFRRHGDRYESSPNVAWQDAIRLTSAESGRFRLSLEQKRRMERHRRKPSSPAR